MIFVNILQHCVVYLADQLFFVNRGYCLFSIENREIFQKIHTERRKYGCLSQFGDRNRSKTQRKIKSFREQGLLFVLDWKQWNTGVWANLRIEIVLKLQEIDSRQTKILVTNTYVRTGFFNCASWICGFCFFSTSSTRKTKILIPDTYVRTCFFNCASWICGFFFYLFKSQNKNSCTRYLRTYGFL